MDRSDDEYRIELFVFPDGTAMEMIVFDREGAPSHTQAAERHDCGSRCVDHRGARREPSVAQQAPPAAGPETDGDVHLCPLCRSALVYPLDWRRNDEATWNLTLRCPNCETQREVTLGRQSVEEFNRELYHGAQALAREAEIVTRRNFEEEAQKIVVALDRDLIQPMDF
jgi:hypothetical protein